MWHSLLMAVVRMGKQGRIVIPSDLRSELGAAEGTEFSARIEQGQLVLETGGSALASIREKLATGSGERSLTDELLETRRAEHRIEESRDARRTGRP